MSLIPDFYHGDTISSWDKLKANVPFVIFKATEGTSFISPKLDTYIKESEAHKIPYWVYVFLKNGDEMEQTKFMVQTCREKVGQFFQGYVLDVERQNTAASVQAALAWLQTHTSTKTMIYTMYAEYPRYKAVIDKRGSTCAWWEARYGKNDGLYSSRYPCHPDADLHQYTDEGICPGISNKCDLSRLSGNKPEIWFTGKSTSDEKVVNNMPNVTADDIISIMEGWEGLSRKDKSHKPIIALYNDHRPLARNYKVTYTDNFCATTISAAYIKANAVKLIGGTECSVERMIEDRFKPAGIWEEDGKKTPHPGWIITYNWDDKTQPNDGWADHIGLVKSVKDGVITVIEGNYGGVVRERQIKVGDGRIRGYAVPKYAEKKEEPVPAPVKVGKKYPNRFPLLPATGSPCWEYGDGMTKRKTIVSTTHIKRVQRLANWINSGDDIPVNGRYNKPTVEAVKKMQKTLKVTVDGDFGKQTLTAAKKYTK